MAVFFGAKEWLNAYPTAHAVFGSLDVPCFRLACDLGSHNPDFVASVGNTFSYKSFVLNFLVFARIGAMYRVPRPGLVGRCQFNKVNYWTPTNPGNEYQQATQTSEIPLHGEALTYRNVTFAKDKNITLSSQVDNGVSFR